MTRKEKPMGFEAAMERLEAIVQELEDGELPLEKAVSVFEEGIRISRQCSRLLDETEKSVTLLLQSAEGEPTETEANPEDLSNG